jgi:hypothetical protein
MKHFAWRAGLIAVVMSVAGCAGDATAPVRPEVSKAPSNSSSTWIYSTIHGPASIANGWTCTWYVQVHNGTAPYTYWWSTSGMIDSGGGNTSDSWTGYKAVSTWGSLDVLVTDANGNSGWAASLIVEDSWSTPIDC